MSRLYCMLLGWLVIAWCGLLPAQDEVRYPIPEKIERPTKADDKGVLQWEAWPEVKCGNCKGTGKIKCTTCARYPDEATKCPDCKRSKDKEAVCPACAGTGTYPDPLEKVLCPGCFGTGRIICGCCPGSGIVRLGEDKRFSTCIGCRGDGCFKCSVCDGKRVVDVAALKPSLREANASSLTKAIATTDEALKAMGTFAPKGDKTRKDVKELTRILLIAQGLYAPIKRAPKVLDELMAATYPGANYQGQAEREVNSMMRIKTSAEYYLKHQRRMLELAQKRAEANEKLLGEQKGK